MKKNRKIKTESKETTDLRQVEKLNPANYHGFQHFLQTATAYQVDIDKTRPICIFNSPDLA